MIRKIRKFLTDSKSRFHYLANLGFYNRLSDERYLKKAFKVELGKELDLENPQTFNEKLQWLKLYDRKSVYTTMVDKYEAKKYVAEQIGEEYIIPTLGVWDTPEDIDFDALPKQFVLKCNHNSGVGMCICKDKSKLNIVEVKRKLRKGLKQNYYLHQREWPYKNVPRKIIAEQYMEDDDSDRLPVYKFFCFNGEPKIVQTIQNDKMPNETIDYFDTEWNLLDLRQNYPNSSVPLPKPKRLTEMVDLARKLAQAKKNFIRIDLYTINQKIYFSEYTFYSDAGMAAFYPTEWDEKLGEWIALSQHE